MICNLNLGLYTVIAIVIIFIGAPTLKCLLFWSIMKLTGINNICTERVPLMSQQAKKRTNSTDWLHVLSTLSLSCWHGRDALCRCIFIDLSSKTIKLSHNLIPESVCCQRRNVVFWIWSTNLLRRISLDVIVTSYEAEHYSDKRSSALQLQLTCTCTCASPPAHSHSDLQGIYVHFRFSHKTHNIPQKYSMKSPFSIVSLVSGGQAHPPDPPFFLRGVPLSEIGL